MLERVLLVDSNQKTLPLISYLLHRRLFRLIMFKLILKIISISKNRHGQSRNNQTTSSS